MLVVGAFADAADVDFTSHSEVGRLTPERGVAGSGLRAGIYGLGGDDLFNTDLATDTCNLGLFFHETIALADRFDVTASGRFNNVAVDIEASSRVFVGDEGNDQPELDGCGVVNLRDR